MRTGKRDPHGRSVIVEGGQESKRARPQLIDATPSTREAAAESRQTRPIGGNGLAAFEQALQAAPRQAVPHREALEEQFGADLRDVGRAAGVEDLLIAAGVRGAATRDVVAFADASPTIDLVVHEVAHVMQYRRGSLDGGPSATEAEARDAARGKPGAAKTWRRPIDPVSFDDTKGAGTRSTDKWFKLTYDSDAFYVRFRSVEGNATGFQDVDVTVQPFDMAHTYAWKDNELAPVAPKTRRISVAPTHMFMATSVGVHTEPGAAVYTFDLTGDTKPDFAIRISRDPAVTALSRRFALRTYDNKTTEDFAWTIVDKLAPGSVRQDPSKAHFTLVAGQDDFVISFELQPSVGNLPALVRMTLQPLNWSRAFQSEMKYWDVRGREVGKGDSHTTMGSWSVPAAPITRTAVVPDANKFAPVLTGEYPEAAREFRQMFPGYWDGIKGTQSACVWTFDLNGGTKPNYSVRIDSRIGATLREYDLTIRDDTGGGVERGLGYHFVQDDAWKYGYSGNRSPRRHKNDFLDDLGDLLKSRHTWHFVITLIPIVGEIVLLAEAIAGYTIFGDKLSTTERVISALAALLPVAGGMIVKAFAKEGAAVARLAATVGRSEDEVMALLVAAEKQSVSAREVQEMRAALKAGRELTESQISTVQQLLRQMDADRRAALAASREARAEADAVAGSTTPPSHAPTPTAPTTAAPTAAAPTAATTWRGHEAVVTQRLRTMHANVGEQVTLDVTNNATGQTVRIRIDNIHDTPAGFQLVDAKFSSVRDLTVADLTSTVTANQRQVYGWIRNGDAITAVPQGANAAQAGLRVGIPIPIAPTVQVHVNSATGIVVRTY